MAVLSIRRSGSHVRGFLFSICGVCLLFLISSGLAQTTRPSLTSLTPTLVAGYAFDETSGTTAADSSGNGLTGTLTNGPTWVLGKYGNGVRLDGTNDYVDLSNPVQLQLTGSITISAWINSSAFPFDDAAIVSKRNNASSGYQLDTTVDTGSRTIGFKLTNSSGANMLRYGSTAMQVNTWYHVAGVYDAVARTMNVYLNGQLDNGPLMGTVTSTQQNSTQNVNVGQRPGSAGTFNFAGTIDDMRIYSRALGQAEIQAGMGTPVGSPSDTQAPTVPGNLTAAAVSGYPINLSWTASTDDVTVTGYQIHRCQGAGCSSFTQIATSTTTYFSDTFGLTGGTSYSYRVRAVDGMGNASANSNTATAITGMLLSPRTSVLTPILTQQFVASGFNGNLTWMVDGVHGGSAVLGTISSTGLYVPPATAGVHTVTVFDGVRSTNATVYVSSYPGTFTRDIDNERTGLNSRETVLTPTNVNAAQFGKLFSYSIDGVSDASPLYVANVNIPGKGRRNVVYVATEHDSVYAFDADTYQSSPLWQVSFIDPAHGITTVPPEDTGEALDISPEIGITGSPVIDASTGTLYVVAKTKEVSGSDTTYVHRLHALDIATGAEKVVPPEKTVPGPIVIQGSVPGTGAGTTGTQVPFISLRHNQRAALLLNNGVVYIAFASHGDQQPYHGWVFGYNASNLQQVMVFNSTPNGEGGGIWQSGDGLASDASGDIFFVTGDGTFDAHNKGSDYGDSIIRLSPTGVVRDYFTPYDQASMDARDIDLGSGGMILPPDQGGGHPHIGLAAGKNGTIYVVDRDNMGHFRNGNDNQILQSLVNIFPNGTFTTGNFKAPVYWNSRLYFSADADFIKRFDLTNGLLSSAPTSQTSFVVNYPGATLGASSNGNMNGILWVIERIDLDPLGQTGVRAPGILHAFDATNLGSGLYNSKDAEGTDGLDYAAKWAAPLIANGKVFVATNARLTAFGLLPNGR